MGVRCLIPGSSMVEQEAVNFEVAGSSPVRGAIYGPAKGLIFFALRLAKIGRCGKIKGVFKHEARVVLFGFVHEKLGGKEN